jgi:hypothetical protein
MDGEPSFIRFRSLFTIHAHHAADDSAAVQLLKQQWPARANRSHLELGSKSEISGYSWEAYVDISAKSQEHFVCITLNDANEIIQ